MDFDASKQPTERKIAVVSGVAGFIGSQLAESLLSLGFTVRGIDSFTDYYAVSQKHLNLTNLKSNQHFELFELDLATSDSIEQATHNADVIFHLAAEPGVRSSWGAAFARYTERNLLGTQRLLEAARHSSSLTRVVVASSSSVYGDAAQFPTPETARLNPRSPYGITKLATEHLAAVYARAWGTPTVSLRLFTVFGPRQRPDMAFHRLIEAALGGGTFPLYGDGQQIRDFTYVSDVVTAFQVAAEAPCEPGDVYNIAGGADATLNDVIELVQELLGLEISIERRPAQAGDPRRTGADTTKAHGDFGWFPAIGLVEGIEHQVRWHRRRSGRSVSDSRSA